MAGLVALLKKIDELRLEVERLENDRSSRRSELLEEEDQLKTEIPEAEKSLQQQFHHERSSLQKNIDDAERLALIAFERVAAFTGSARRQALQEAPARFMEIWQQQKKVLASLLDRFDGISSDSSICTHRPLSAPWSADYWTTSNSSTYSPL